MPTTRQQPGLLESVEAARLSAARWSLADRDAPAALEWLASLSHGVARRTLTLRLRLKALGIEHAVFGTEDKRPAAEKILASLNLTWAQAAAVGDDWPDLPVLQRVALACAPCQAHPEVSGRAHFITSRRGGEGAVREVCDLLLVAHGRYADVLRDYLA